MRADSGGRLLLEAITVERQESGEPADDFSREP